MTSHAAPDPEPALPPERWLAFLADPAAFPHRPAKVEVVQTHSAYVALAPPFAYKIKKPVNLGFLDFSTLEKRRYYTAREVELNRRLCPDVYLGVVPVSEEGGRLKFGAGGRVVDYAVHMKLLDPRYFLKERLARGEVGLAEIERLAGTLAAFYQAHPSTPESAEWGRIENIRRNTDGNFGQSPPHVGETISPAAFDAIRWFTEQAYAQKGELFEARRRDGWIRDCHGDLHLEHIHIDAKRVRIYDCIEFTDRFRFIDVASDLAFLAMDFDFHGRADLARLLLARLTEQLGDPGLFDLLDFYKCYRAYVRGKVEHIRGLEAEVPEPQRGQSRETSRRYFRLALRYALTGSKPAALLVMGRVGSGKSTLAEKLAEELGCAWLSSDRLRKELAGVPATQRGDEAARKALYAAAMTKRVYQRLLQAAKRELRAGNTVVLDATWSKRREREEARAVCLRLAAPCYFIEAQASDETILKRLEARAERTDVVSDARRADFEPLSQAYEAPAELPSAGHIAVSTEEPPEENLGEIFHALTRRTHGLD